MPSYTELETAIAEFMGRNPGWAHPEFREATQSLTVTTGDDVARVRVRASFMPSDLNRAAQKGELSLVLESAVQRAREQALDEEEGLLREAVEHAAVSLPPERVRQCVESILARNPV